MPADGVLLLQTVVSCGRDHLRAHGTRLTSTDLAFLRVLRETIFPGGQLPLPTSHNPKGVTEYAEDAGFTVTRVQALGPHYPTTLNCWATALHEHRDRAIELAGQDTYSAYIRYLTGCADYFRRGYIDVMQFTCTPAPTRAALSLPASLHRPHHRIVTACSDMQGRTGVTGAGGPEAVKRQETRTATLS
jgi:cyclopropane-fatty-acyl-phospholipid synthase